MQCKEGVYYYKTKGATTWSQFGYWKNPSDALLQFQRQGQTDYGGDDWNDKLRPTILAIYKGGKMIEVAKQS
jgi:hypothetical protein